MRCQFSAQGEYVCSSSQEGATGSQGWGRGGGDGRGERWQRAREGFLSLDSPTKEILQDARDENERQVKAAEAWQGPADIRSREVRSFETVAENTITGRLATQAAQRQMLTAEIGKADLEAPRYIASRADGSWAAKVAVEPVRL